MRRTSAALPTLACIPHPLILTTPLVLATRCAEFHFNESGQIWKHAVDCVQYSGMQLQLPLLARMTRRQQALVPGLAGGSFDEC